MIQWVFRDLMLSILLSLIAIVMLSNQNPPVESQDSRPPGDLIATITWPEGNSDVDMWLDAPGEKIPVGYTNKDGEVWNLLRDDTGLGINDVGINYENAYTRGAPEGEYIINLHAYRVDTFPLSVKVEVQMSNHHTMTNIWKGTLTLTKPGEELTAVRFKIDKNGNLLPGSIYQIFQPLRNGMKNK